MAQNAIYGKKKNLLSTVKWSAIKSDILAYISLKFNRVKILCQLREKSLKKGKLLLIVSVIQNLLHHFVQTLYKTLVYCLFWFSLFAIAHFIQSEKIKIHFNNIFKTFQVLIHVIIDLHPCPTSFRKYFFWNLYQLQIVILVHGCFLSSEWYANGFLLWKNN